MFLDVDGVLHPVQVEFLFSWQMDANGGCNHQKLGSYYQTVGFNHDILG